MHTDSGPEFASFLRQLKGFAFPLVKSLGISPVNVGVGDAVERRDSVTRTAAGRGPFDVDDGDSCVGLAFGLVGRGEGAGKAGLGHGRSPGCEVRRGGASSDSCRKPPGRVGLSRVAVCAIA
jgi:hypothetical protein